MPPYFGSGRAFGSWIQSSLRHSATCDGKRAIRGCGHQRLRTDRQTGCWSRITPLKSASRLEGRSFGRSPVQWALTRRTSQNRTCGPPPANFRMALFGGKVIRCLKSRPMSPQQFIAHYRITARLGKGGMGEVCRATDTKLSREVAGKVLPDAFADDSDRLARFRREAQVLGSLNHPNIASIHGVEELALIMELVEGLTLAERIALGPIPSEEVLDIARQITEALEYAHDKGIVHRDLKPANIKITPEGRVKVLDFGLARALASESGATATDLMSSSTVTLSVTVPGVVMGTAAYMAPEQARGQEVDQRADIWAFGVVLYEMLTGHPPFAGSTTSDMLAAVLKT